jgi:predicted AAA+ superfamily ATPase
MKRSCLVFLKKWLTVEDHKPLVIRGARQVGKTWLVRHLAHTQNKRLIEVNLEKNPQLISLFTSNDPHQILLNLSAAFNEPILPKECLLFLDEIQAAPDLLAKLRWFAEDLPALPVIAAGSLLEFVLEKHSFSMPVGRISYMHLEPFSFEEFLMASDKQGLLDYLLSYRWEIDIPRAIHEQLLAHFKEYLIIGGMPAAVSCWVNKRSLKEVNQVHYDLMATYHEDIAKYRGRMATERLNEVMLAVPKHLGEKFVYAKVNPSIQTSSIKHSLDLLCKARICHRVFGCAANGVPLASEIQDKYLKVLFLDVGLCSAALGLSLDQFYLTEEITLINKGGIAEQVVGQMLRTLMPYYIEPQLYYWHREEKGANAEIDYVLQHRNQVVPLEVKSGSTGSLKSLHFFMGVKHLPLAVRVNSDFPSKTKVNVKDYQGNPVSYTLLSLPFYLVGQLHRLVDDSLIPLN